ncbi:MAG TPA: hypothetical protein VI298_09620 [Geobacteraceae bacterium]
MDRLSCRTVAIAFALIFAGSAVSEGGTKIKLVQLPAGVAGAKPETVPAQKAAQLNLYSSTRRSWK